MTCTRQQYVKHGDKTHYCNVIYTFISWWFEKDLQNETYSLETGNSLLNMTKLAYIPIIPILDGG